ncbi:YbaN family protein [Falsirhodobacter deserti]|uniref:YbaN family protein n=1 Tax=Falsirhodobacter deserti TaxID=1365611 RepID=UPI000FE35E13|nr:YbaN family protein [Falsirhodobacter deserti]
MRLLWGIGGGLALILATVGAVLPLLPTTPFLLLAAFCLSRSSDRWHRWLLNHGWLGPPIHDWRTRRAVSRRVKWKASLSMLAVLGISALLHVDMRLLAVQALVLCVVATFLWTRPE